VAKRLVRLRHLVNLVAACGSHSPALDRLRGFPPQEAAFIRAVPFARRPAEIHKSSATRCRHSGRSLGISQRPPDTFAPADSTRLRPSMAPAWRLSTRGAAKFQSGCSPGYFFSENGVERRRRRCVAPCLFLPGVHHGVHEGAKTNAALGIFRSLGNPAVLLLVVWRDIFF